MGTRKAVRTDMPRVLRLLRQLFQWSKTEAARRSGLSVSLYSRYEDGLVEPTLSNIIKIMVAFSIDFDTLIGKKPIRLHAHPARGREPSGTPVPEELQ